MKPRVLAYNSYPLPGCEYSPPMPSLEEEAAPVELTPPRPPMDPLALLRKALQSGFCEHASNVEPVRRRTVSSDASIESTESWGLESILSQPFDNLKKVVQEGFCAPTEITAGPKSDETLGSALTSRSFDSEDAQKERLDETMETVETVDDDDDEGNCVVIETHPGETGRTSRVLRSLETFFFTVLAVVGTLYVLQRQDINFDIQLQPKISGQVTSSFISFAPRTLHGRATTRRMERAKSQFECDAWCDGVCENPCTPVLGDGVGECVCEWCKWQLLVANVN
jgi:hypothetical protein